MRNERTNEQLKIELLSQWKLEAESRNWEIVFQWFSNFDDDYDL